MFVSDILSQKGGLVFSVTPATTVAEVAKQLSVRRIGSVLILNEHSSVVGIVSERDLVRAIAAHGDKAMELEARQVMTRDVASPSVAASVSSFFIRSSGAKGWPLTMPIEAMAPRTSGPIGSDAGAMSMRMRFAAGPAAAAFHAAPAARR